jgi:dihydropteroate synthase
VVSIDTTWAEVAEFALDCGAGIVNDISAGREDPKLLPLVARRGSAVILMHMQGEPGTMQMAPHYENVLAEVRDFLAGAVASAERAGIDRSHCIVDPGIGFGKRLEHNLALLARLGELTSLGCPVLVGASRKRFIGELTGQSEPTGRLAGSLAAGCWAYLAGANILRVHDVRETREALAVCRAIRQAKTGL